MPIKSVFVVLCAASVSFLSAGSIHAKTSKPNYNAQVLRTSYGIPHIQATDWGSLGYGYGYAFAEDNVCVMAREVLAANGTQSRYFGGGTVNSDRVYKMVNSAARVSAAWGVLDIETRDLLTGYAAGYNRYLRDTDPAALPADCRSQPWVQAIAGEDVLKVLRKLLVRAGTGNFVAALVAATPPPAVAALGVDGSPETMLAGAVATDEALAAIDPAELPDFSVERFGSNAVGLGRDLTGGAGALLGNPHFPWFGIERFYAVHLTIPGRYDVMGASIYGFPLVNIGFNRNLAWSHTVSTARRFVLRELTIVPSKPTSYVYDGKVVDMQPETVTVDVRQADGSVLPSSHTFWQTQFGPVLVPAAVAAWSPVRAYALTDINLENARAFRQYREMGTARNLDEFTAVLRKYAGLPWVNTIAADSAGNAFYGDIGSMPNASNAKLAACIKPGVSAALSHLATVRTRRLHLGLRSRHRCRCARARHLRRRQHAGPDAPRLRAELQRQLLAGEPGSAARGLFADHRRGREPPAELPHPPRHHPDPRPPGGRRRTPWRAASIASGCRTCCSATATTAPRSCSTTC
jgi:acyl-homoserine-lactone acylase